jgi:AraC-like DNA-binding protein
MQVHFVAPDHQITFSGRLPENLKPFTLTEATRKAASGPFGYLLFQHIDTSTFSVRYHCYFLNEANQLSVVTDKEMLELFFNLDSPLDYHVEGLGNLMFPKNAYNMMYVPFLQGTLSFQKNQNYQSFSIRMDASYLDAFAPFFPAIADLQQKIKMQQPTVLYKKNPVAPRDLLSNIKDILTCTYSDKLFKIFLEAKIIAILLASLENNETYKRATGKLRRSDISQIEAVRQLLVENLHKQYTLSELAAAVGLSETKLSKGFILIVGKTWFSYQLHARMEKAKELLLYTENSASYIGI